MKIYDAKAYRFRDKAAIQVGAKVENSDKGDGATAYFSLKEAKALRRQLSRVIRSIEREPATAANLQHSTITERSRF